MDTRIGRHARLWAAVSVVGALAFTAGAQPGPSPPHPQADATTSPPAETAVMPGVTPVSPPTPETTSPAGGGAPTAGDLATAVDQAAPPDSASAADEDHASAETTPAGQPTPVRAPSAILRVLDKVTAQTMAFDAPIGRRVRFKSLVFEVKACETHDVGAPQPQPAAYLLITSDAGFAAGPVLVPRQVFKGWMFANAPDVHAVTHAVYDAWLVSCSATAPAT